MQLWLWMVVAFAVFSPLLRLCFLFMELETKVYISLVFFSFSPGIIASDVCRVKQKVLLYNLSFCCTRWMSWLWKMKDLKTTLHEQTLWTAYCFCSEEQHFPLIYRIIHLQNESAVWQDPLVPLFSFFSVSFSFPSFYSVNTSLLPLHTFLPRFSALCPACLLRKCPVYFLLSTANAAVYCFMRDQEMDFSDWCGGKDAIEKEDNRKES